MSNPAYRIPAVICTLPSPRSPRPSPPNSPAGGIWYSALTMLQEGRKLFLLNRQQTNPKKHQLGLSTHMSTKGNVCVVF